MDPNASTWFAGWFVVGMFLAALNAKALGVCVVYGLGLLAVYPDMAKAGLLTAMLIPAYILAAFRD